MKYVCLRYGSPKRRCSAATLRFEDGNATIMDGPACTSNENLIAVQLLEADDLNHLITLLSHEPPGTIEIRPMQEESI